MMLHEILQTMADNAKPNANGEVCTNGHLMHNLLLDGNNIFSVNESNLNAMMYSPESFSLKPRTHKVNGFTVPAPETEAPQDEYFVAASGAAEFYHNTDWTDHDLDKRRLERGLVHLTEKAAIANAKAMLGIDPNKD